MFDLLLSAALTCPVITRQGYYAGLYWELNSNGHAATLTSWAGNDPQRTYWFSCQNGAYRNHMGTLGWDAYGPYIK